MSLLDMYVVSQSPSCLRFTGYTTSGEQAFVGSSISITNNIPRSIHTFKYSVREGTRAARLPDQIPERVKTVRSEAVRKLADEMKLAYRKSFIGKKQTVLVETFDRRGFAKGYGEHYVPVVIEQKRLEKNRFYDVSIIGIIPGKEPLLQGKLISGENITK